MRRDDYRGEGGGQTKGTLLYLIRRPCPQHGISSPPSPWTSIARQQPIASCCQEKNTGAENRAKSRAAASWHAPRHATSTYPLPLRTWRTQRNEHALSLGLSLGVGRGPAGGSKNMFRACCGRQLPMFLLAEGVIPAGRHAAACTPPPEPLTSSAPTSNVGGNSCANDRNCLAEYPNHDHCFPAELLMYGLLHRGSPLWH